MKTFIFDCWASYGPHPAKDFEERWTLEHLLEDLTLYGYSGALVRHEQALHYDAMSINLRLAEEVAPHRDRLQPCWMAMPHQAGDFPAPKEFAKHILNYDIPAVWMAPATHGYPVHQDVLGELAGELEKLHIPILLPVSQVGIDYAKTIEFCRTFPLNPIILGEISWGSWRYAVAVMDACKNTCIEFSSMQGNRAVEWFANRYGIERCLLGSGLPRRSGGAARGFVDWSLLDDEDLVKFAGGNLSIYLGMAFPDPPAELPEIDPIAMMAREGRPLHIPVLDAHCHVLHDGMNGAGASYVMPQGGFPDMLELTERMGIDLTALMSWNGTVSNDVVAGNELIADLVQRFPDDCLGLSSCDPTHQQQEEILPMCEYLHGTLGFRGLKPYVKTGISYAHPAYAPYWEYANAHKLYGLLHVGAPSGGIAAVSQLAERYPDVTFLVAHSGSSWSFARQVAAVGKEHQNVVAELTYTAALNGVIEWLVEQLGPDRVLFGTDAPMRDPRPQLGWCVHSKLPETTKRKILGANFAAILARAELPGHPLPEIARIALG